MSNFIYPKFETFEQFELLVNDIFKIRTQNINFQIYGRKGQKQYGIDGYGFDYINNSFIVTQCKNFTNEKKGINKTKLIKALQEFDKKELPFYNDIETFYYVTAENRDKDFSNIEIEYNKLREEKSLPKVKIFTWDDLCDEIENNQDLLYKFFLKNIPLSEIKNINYNLKSIDNTIILKLGENISDKQIELFKNSFIEKINIEKTFNNKDYNESILILGLDGGYKKNLFGETDLNLDFSILYEENKKNGLDSFLQQVVKIINVLKMEIGLKKIIIKSHIQPCLAIYIGKTFKNSTSGIEFITSISTANLFLSSKSEYLLYSEPGISEKRVYLKENGDINNIALFYNVSQNNLQIENELSKEIFKQINPKYGFYLEGNKIENSSHGFSQIKYITNKIKTLANEYSNGSSRLNIHLILICPEQIAFIIGTLIEKINADIYLYYQNNDSTDYILFNNLPKQ